MYIVGKPFRSHIGLHKTGDELEDSVVESWRTYPSLVSTNMLYKVADDKSDIKSLPGRLQRMFARGKAAAEHADKPHGQTPWDKPADVEKAEEFRDVSMKARLKSNESHEERRERVQEKKASRDPVEIPEQEPQADTRKDEAEKAGTDFDADKIRVMKLDELREMAEERGISKSGTKAEVAQRVIDDEIEKQKAAE